MTALRIGTRGSKLALIQTEMVADLLRAAHPGLDVAVITISTAGDKDQTSALSAGEGVGWFTTAIQDALLRNEIDVAVHSYKDLPTQRPEGLVIAAVPKREDPRDALVSASGVDFRGLKQGASLGPAARGARPSFARSARTSNSGRSAGTSMAASPRWMRANSMPPCSPSRG